MYEEEFERIYGKREKKADANLTYEDKLVIEDLPSYALSGLDTAGMGEFADLMDTTDPLVVDHNVIALVQKEAYLAGKGVKK